MSRKQANETYRVTLVTVAGRFVSGTALSLEDAVKERERVASGVGYGWWQKTHDGTTTIAPAHVVAVTVEADVPAFRSGEQ